MCSSSGLGSGSLGKTDTKQSATVREPGTHLCPWQWEGDFGQAYAEAILSKPLNNTTLNLIAKGKR